MMSLAATRPTKKRKRNKAENSGCNKTILKSSLCKLGDDRKKVLEPARGGSQDVNVAFYSANEMTLPDNKDREIEKVLGDHRQGTRGMLQTCCSYIKKVKEDMVNSRYASHRDHMKHTRKHSSYHCSSLLKTNNLLDLLPSSKFHSVRKRTPVSSKFVHLRTGAGLNLFNLHVSESKLGIYANRSTYLAVPISVGASQTGTFSVDSQILERTTESELFPVCGIEKKHSNKGTHNLDFKGLILDAGGLEVRRKVTKAYVRNKHREPFFKDERPDLYALHLLANAALNLGPEPIFHIQVQKHKGQSEQGRNEHERLLINSSSSSSKVNDERNVGERSALEAAFVSQQDLQSDEVSMDVLAFPVVNDLICTSSDDKQNFIQERKNCDKDLISKDNDTINLHKAGFHVIKESQEVAINADEKAAGAENECIDCHSSIRTQPLTLEGFQTTKSIPDATKLPCAPSGKDSILPEHKERIDEAIVKRGDIDLKRVSEFSMEQYSVFVSVEPVYHEKVSSAQRELESCNIYRENSQPRLLTCMETPQISEGYPSSSTKSFFDRSLEVSLNSKECPSSFISTKFRNQSPGYRVGEIVQSSKLKAARMVDAAVKVMPSTKVGEMSNAMIGKSLDSTGIQHVGVNSRISRLQYCSYLQNWGPGNCHQDVSCNPKEVASIVHSINSTLPTISLYDSQIPLKLTSACVAALLMIQACSDIGLPPAESMEILEHAARDLHPQYSQNLHIYWEIEELMRIIKTQVLSLVRTPASNLQM